MNIMLIFFVIKCVYNSRIQYTYSWIRKTKNNRQNGRFIGRWREQRRRPLDKTKILAKNITDPNLPRVYRKL